MSESRYIFEAADGKDVEITVSGRYTDGTADVEVSYDGLYREWDSIDAGDVDAVFTWLIGCGVNFESKRSMWFNYFYVSDVMIEQSCKESELLDRAAEWTDKQLDGWTLV